MEKIILEGTENTPELVMDHERHSMLFRGDSRPEDVRTFYLPILEWLENYEKQLFFLTDQGAKIKLVCNFEFEYFNSSSAKYLMDIISKLGDISKIDGVTLELNWHYDAMDEDMLESGEEFEDMLGVKFNFVKVD